jgi:choice-of-anchor C domain-containing protein
MKRLILSTLTAASLTMALVGVSAAAAPDVTNGSFETGLNVGAGFAQLSAGDSTNITGWTVASGTVDYAGTYWQAADGVRSIDLNGTSAGAVRQSIATEVGKTYKVSFSLSGNPEGPDGIKTMTADVGAAPIAFSYEVGALNTLADMKWASKSFTFVAAAATTVLTFTSTSTTAGVYGPVLDMVRVELVNPNAAATKAFAVCKKGGWKALHDGAGRAFKNQGDCVSYFATKFRNSAAVR